MKAEMMSYRRPSWEPGIFRDPSGAIIEYGRRWVGRPGGQAPEETYSVESHPERFAPLHAVADALIEHLTWCYDASSGDAPDFAAALSERRVKVLHALRVAPANADAAPIIFAYTDPGVLVHAGLLNDFPFPDCSCDACDETAESAADGLEEIVIAVVEGRYQETYEAGDGAPWPQGGWSAVPPSPGPDMPPPRQMPCPARAGYRIVAPDGSFSARGDWSVFGTQQEERLEPLREQLARLPDGWQPWPIRG